MSIPKALVKAGLAIVLGIFAAAPVEAGCLREWEQCGECAGKAAWRSLRDLDASGFKDAWIDSIDCDIDLYHCVILGAHHDYDCP